jgi:bifunctional DNA-binding transcriptional regulator/antitoxin component of YhaV-PrlF toxin-antitoxin module
MGEKSTIAKANSKSPSVRTTVPQSIAKKLGLAVGDVLEWDVVRDDGRESIRVRKLVPVE